MKRLKKFILIASIFVGMLSGTQAVNASTDGYVYSELQKADYIEGQVIIALERQVQTVQLMRYNGNSLEGIKQICGTENLEWLCEYENETKQVRTMGLESLEDTSLSTDMIDFYIAEYETDRNVWDVLEELEQLDGVICAEPNYICHSFADASEYSFLEEETACQWHLDAIRAVDAWKTIEDNEKIPGEGTVVAVIDTGASLAHTGLLDNIWKNEIEEAGEEGTDDDANGYVDDIYGVNMANTFHNMTDSSGHGTLMSGLIGLEAGNGDGVGIAYGAKVMPVKVSTDGNFGTDMAVKGIEYAVANGADVLSMSFGTYYDSYLLQTAIRAASEKCMLVAAAGNESLPTENDTVDYEKSKNVYPAAYTSVIGVMGMDKNRALGEYSNWDSNPDQGGEYELVAPGTMIYSSYLRNGYDTTTGTSPATAITAGSLAVFRSLFPDKELYPSAALQQIFLESQQHTVEYKDVKGYTWTYRSLDMMDMVEYAMTQNIICDRQSPWAENKTEGTYLAGDCVKIQVMATDNVGIESAKVYYRQQAETTWQCRELNNENSKESLYQVQIHTKASQPGMMEYYFEIYDGTFYTLLGDEQKPIELMLYKNKLSSMAVESPGEAEYTGKEILMDVTIWDKEYRLVLGEDYILSYENNVDVGTAIVYITGIGLYTEQTSTYFFIKKKEDNISDTTQDALPLPLPPVQQDESNANIKADENNDSKNNIQDVIINNNESNKQKIKKLLSSKVKLSRTYIKKRKKAKLSWKLPGQKVEQWYIYRSTKKNKGYKLWKVTKKKSIQVKCYKKKYYYKVAGVKKIQGKKYKSKKSEAKKCVRI